MKRLLATFAGAVVLVGASPSFAQTSPAASPIPSRPTLGSHPDRKEPAVEWDPRWPRFRVGEYVATGVFLAATFGSLAIPEAPERWTGDNAFDREVRSFLRAGTSQSRDAARDASDLVMSVLVNQLLVDALIVTWWGHDKGSVAWQMTLIDAEALALNGALSGLVAGLASRRRPYVESCTDDPRQQSYDCRGSKRYRSFFSGHTSTSFTAAGLICSHHAHLPLYGGGSPEVLACVASFAAASTVGAMRVISDQHFASDVLVGAAVGTMSGVGLPWLLHYRGGATPASNAEAKSDVSIRLAPAPFGGYVTGTF